MEEPESEYKTYEVEFAATIHCKARVQAKDILEAKEETTKIHHCDIDEVEKMEIEEILEVREEDEI